MLKAWSLDWLKTLSFGGMARGGGGGTFYVHLAVRGQILFFATEDRPFFNVQVPLRRRSR